MKDGLITPAWEAWDDAPPTGDRRDLVEREGVSPSPERALLVRKCRTCGQLRKLHATQTVCFDCSGRSAVERERDRKRRHNDAAAKARKAKEAGA